MSYPTTISGPPRVVHRRWRVLAAILVTALGVMGAVWGYLAWAEERDFQEALAETDRLDPGWRFQDIDAARAKVPDDRNAALQVLKVRRLGGAGGMSLTVEEQIWALPGNVQLNAEQTAALREFFANRAKARAEAHLLKDFVNGRYPNVYDPKEANFNLDWVQRPRDIARFLQLGALLAVQEGDAGPFADVCRASINNARSMGDEPSAIALLVRIAILEIALAPLERGLAQIELPPAELRRLQELLQAEIDEPRLLWVMRGERAIGTDMIEAMRDGRLRRSTLVFAQKGWRAWVPNWLPTPVSQDRAAFLRGMNAMVEASRQPVEKQLDAVDEANAKWQGRDWMLDGLLPTCNKTALAHIRNQARLLRHGRAGRGTLSAGARLLAGNAGRAGASGPAQERAAGSVRRSAAALPTAGRRRACLLRGRRPHR